MAEHEEEDPFAFFAQSCHISRPQLTTLRTSPFFLEQDHFPDSDTLCPFPSPPIQQPPPQLPAPPAVAGSSLNLEEEEEPIPAIQPAGGSVNPDLGSIPDSQLTYCTLNTEDAVPEQIEEGDEDGSEKEYIDISDDDDDDEEEEECRVKVSAAVLEKIKLFKEARDCAEANRLRKKKAKVCDENEEGGAVIVREREREREVGGCSKRKLPATLSAEYMWGVNRIGATSRDGRRRNKEGVEIIEIG